MDQKIIFDKHEFCGLLREQSFSGNIKICETNKILNKLLEYNICGNRNHFEDMDDGFMDGDLFYIQNGISILLSIDKVISKTYNADICIRLYS
jgi:hypothetical protein